MVRTDYELEFYQSVVLVVFIHGVICTFVRIILRGLSFFVKVTCVRDLIPVSFYDARSGYNCQRVWMLLSQHPRGRLYHSCVQLHLPLSTILDFIMSISA